MKILKQEQTGSRVRMEVEVDSAEYSSAVTKVMEQASREMNIPGFRPGKAPKHIIEKNINSEFVKAKALEHIMEKNYGAVLKESKIEPVDYPRWDLISADEEKGCAFWIEVDVMPEVKLGKYKGLKGERKEEKVQDTHVEEYVKSVREEASQMQEVFDRSVKAGDIAELDIEGSIAGEKKDALSQAKLPILVGDQRIAPGFDDHIIGMKIAEAKEFKLQLPKDYYIQEFSEQEAVFKVEVKRIVERNVPEFTDEFVKRISSFNTAQEYWDDIKRRMEEVAKGNADAALKDSLLEQVSKDSTVDMPGSIVERETDSMLNELAANLSRQNLTLENYIKSRRMEPQQLREELKPRASDRAKAKLVLTSIADAEGISVTDEEMNNELAEVAKESGGKAEELKNNETMKEYIREYLLRRKALDFIVENAKV